MTSKKQIQANQRNAEKSTGPITPEGKEIVSCNAIKHGVFAREAVITKGDGKEDEEEYYRFLSDLVEELKPQGRLEHVLVEKIAIDYWRLRRLIRYESGEIQSQLHNFKAKAINEYYGPQPFPSEERDQPEMKYFSYDDQIADEEYQQELTKIIVAEAGDWNPREDKNFLEYVFHTRLKGTNDENSLSNERHREAKCYVESLTPQKLGRLRRSYINRQYQIVREMEEVTTWQRKFDILERTKSVPEQKELAKITKYETSLERSIIRNLSTLERLQDRRRRGHAE